MKIKKLGMLSSEMKKYLGIQKKYAEEEIVLLRIDGEVGAKEICLFVPVKKEVEDLSLDELRRLMKRALSDLE